ncbi:hypothetical protein ANCDUO_17820 [Ancylostoma duodenale]|uniref:Uncharacterized protein n=1 Tax=Ancylostoma duodenale TaxID=51022 RepID=A0A0C2C721_9BILA|nr:hypothetical protein ANCDUO_17820 [Ancylostoma duodenale]
MILATFVRSTSNGMSSQSVADRRRQVLVGELPPDFLRLIVPREQEATSFPQQQLVYAGGSFVPPNTRGRVSITIADANLVRNYGIVRMDPYCRSELIAILEYTSDR